MVITLSRNSYTMTDVAISNIPYKYNKLSIYYLLASVVIWLLFTPHAEILEGLLCIIRIAMVAIMIASGVIGSELIGQVNSSVIQLVFNFILRGVILC